MDQTITNTDSKSSNNNVLIIPLFAVSYLIFEFNIYYAISTAIFFHQFILLYKGLGEKIPFRNLVGTMFSLNFLFAPVLLFYWLNPIIDPDYSMRGDPETYFQYAIPAILLFLIGLNIKSKKEEETLDLVAIRALINRFPSLPLQFVIFGVLADFFRDSWPSEWAFVALSLGYLKFIGLFLNIVSDKPFNFIFLILTYGNMILLSLGDSMYGEFLNLLFFLGFYLCVRYKPSHGIKILGILAGLGLIILIQKIKHPLRKQTIHSFNDLKNLGSAFEESKAVSKEQSTEEEIGEIILRLNQGWVTSSTMQYHKEGGFTLQNGKHSRLILELALIPRVLNPTRALVGDAALFNNYSGFVVAEGTSIALGVPADAYVDFGKNGIFVVFVFGLILNLFIKLYHLMDIHYGLAKIFLPICFFYVRPDNDTFVCLGAIIKTTFVIWIVLFILYKLQLQNKLSLEK